MLPDVSFVSIVLDISLRSLAVAAVVAFALAALRVRTAAVRHAAWTVAMLAMLCMPAQGNDNARGFLCWHILDREDKRCETV